MSDELIFDPLEKAWRRLQVAVIQAENKRIEKLILGDPAAAQPRGIMCGWCGESLIEGVKCGCRDADESFEARAN